MKKVICLLVSLLMLFSCAAMGEEVSQEELMQSFMNNLETALNEFDFASNALNLTAYASGSETFSLTQQLEGNLTDILINADGLDTPVDIQVGQEAIWISANGQAFVLTYENLQDIFSSASQVGVQEFNMDAISQIFQLFAAYVIFPGIKTNPTEDGAMVITIQMTAKQVLLSLCALGEAVVSNDELLSAVLPFLSAAGITDAEQVKAQWPAIREQLSSVETDAALNGTIRIAPQSEGMTVTGDISLSGSGQAYTLTFASELLNNASGKPQSFTLTEALNGTMYNGRTAELMNLDVKADLVANTVNAFLDVPQAGSFITFTASSSQISGLRTMQCSLNAYRAGEPVFSANITESDTRLGTFSLNAVFNAEYDSLLVNVYKDRTFSSG